MLIFFQVPDLTGIQYLFPADSCQVVQDNTKQVELLKLQQEAQERLARIEQARDQIVAYQNGYAQEGTGTSLENHALMYNNCPVFQRGKLIRGNRDFLAGVSVFHARGGGDSSGFSGADEESSYSSKYDLFTRSQLSYILYSG